MTSTEKEGREAFNKIMVGLHGVTPGKWHAEYTAQSDNVVRTNHSNYASIAWCGWQEHSASNAAHIALCSPEKILAIAALINELDAINEGLIHENARQYEEIEQLREEMQAIHLIAAKAHRHRMNAGKESMFLEIIEKRAIAALKET